MSKSERTAGHPSAASVCAKWAASRRPEGGDIAALTLARRMVNLDGERGTPEAGPLAMRAGFQACLPRMDSGPSCPPAPQAPRPSSQNTDGLQLASSWTRDGLILMRVRAAGISSGCCSAENQKQTFLIVGHRAKPLSDAAFASAATRSG
jgi:hypothetical protein